jgi:hypothetical protein
MPNWCSNSLTLKHEDKNKLDELEKQLSESDVFFQHLHPRPKDQDANWYEWNIENWGTKWDVNVNEGYLQRIDDNTLSISFDTAWGPPTKFYDFLFEQGWDVTAKYYEPGMGFVGEYDNSIDDCWEYDLSDESTLEAIPTELREWFGIDEEFEFYKDNNEIEGEGDAE